MLAKAIKSSRLVRLLIDLRVTVVCLGLLFVLTFLGTLYQLENGIYAAQERYFSSWVVFVGGFLPLPGARLVMWVMFVNLVGASIFRFVYKKSRVGILVIHLGLYALFLGMFFTTYFATESSLVLQEGEGRNTSADYYAWELAVWEEGSSSRTVVAADIRRTVAGEVIEFAPYDVRVQIEAFYRNSQAFVRTGSEAVRYVNASNIGSLEPARVSPKPEENAPGALVRLLAADGQVIPVLLYGLDSSPVSVVAAGRRMALQLRQYQHPLPMVITLADFRAEFYPGTDTPRSFESDVVVTTDGGQYEANISMNKPLRQGAFTFYQAAYDVDATGAQYSRLAIVENRGRVVPYVGTAIVGLGLLLHFIQTLTRPLRRRRTQDA